MKSLLPWIQSLSDRAEGGDMKALETLCDALDAEIRKRDSRRCVERYSFAAIVTHLREVFPELALSSKPWTVAKYVKTLVERYKYAVAEKQRVEATVEFARALEMLKEVKVTQ